MVRDVDVVSHAPDVPVPVCANHGRHHYQRIAAAGQRADASILGSNRLFTDCGVMMVGDPPRRGCRPGRDVGVAMERDAGKQPSRSAPDPELTISDLVERTGVPAATLRTWESRYGAPLPTRLPSGHRRFAESDIGLVAEIVRLRGAGLALGAAIAQADTPREEPNPSLFRVVSSRHPILHPQMLLKRTLLAFTRAIEDECCARAERPLLFAAFQRQRFYWQSKDRWQDLARTADAAFVFADFDDHSALDARPVRLALAESAPLRREWAVVCDDGRHPACVIASERPGQDRVPDVERRFEVIWSLDPEVVRDAARVCAGVATSLQPAIRPQLGDRLTEPVRDTTVEVGHAHALFTRVLGYLDTV